MDFPIQEEFRDLLEEAIVLRRELHKIPETEFQEKKTSAFIASYLKKLGLQVRERVAKTGVIGYLAGKKAEKTYAFRADMDALPVMEQTGVEFSSTHLGNMHACGHDGHMTAVLLLAKYLVKKKHQLKDNILFIFQPGEEGSGGALPMIQEGILKEFHVDAIFGMHIHPDLEEGRIGCCAGPLMAQNGELDIIIKGESSHGASPQDGKDSIVIAAQLLNGIQSIISRNIDPLEGKVITIGTIKGGEKRNIISKETILEGTMRAFRENVYEKMKNRLQKIVQGMEQAYECEIQLNIRDMYPPVTNDEELFTLLEDILPKKNLKIVTPLMISEDFSFYQKEIPGLFFLLGSKNSQKGYIYGLHSAQFNFDEKILPIAVQVYYEILKKLEAIE